MLSERECAECLEDDAAISMEVRNRLGRIRKATDLALPRLAAAPLDNAPSDNPDNCQNEPIPAPDVRSELLLPQNWGPGGDPSGSPELGRGGLLPDEPAIIEVDPRTRPAFLGRNEVPRPLPYAATHRREDHRVIHAAARAQSYRSARDADKPYF